MGNRVAPTSRPSSYPQVTGQSTSPKQGGPNGLRGEERGPTCHAAETRVDVDPRTLIIIRSVRRDVAVARGLLGPRAQTSPGSRKGRSTSRDEPAPGPTRQWAQGHAVARAAAACPPPPGGLHIELLIPTPNGTARRRRSPAPVAVRRLVRGRRRAGPHADTIAAATTWGAWRTKSLARSAWTGRAAYVASS